MKKTLTYLKKYKKEIVIGPLFKLIEATFELFIPLVVAAIIDDGIRGGDSSLIIKNSILMIILGILGLIFSVTAQYYCAKAAVGYASDVRKVIFEKIQTLSYTELDSIGTSTLISRLTNDTSALQNGTNLVLRLVLRSPFIVIGAAVMAFFVDPRSAVWFVIVIPLLSLIIFGIMALTFPMHKKVQKKLEVVLGLCDENIGGARVIRAFCAEESEKERFTEENRNLYSLQKTAGRLSALMNPVTYVIINAATIALLLTGAVRVDAGAIQVGAVVALFNYMSQILIELLKFANVIVNVTKAAASVDRVESLINPETKEAEAPIPSTESFSGTITFENVTLRYTKDAEAALEGITFSADMGETVGIIGGTGSGKTSLINLIAGLYPTESGTVSYNGKDISLYDKKELLSKIAYVPQKSVLFKGTVRENLLWGANAPDEELWAALRAAQAEDFIREKEGLDTSVSQGGKNFSGGQRQRLAVARALVRRPEILILDDSSSALDYATDKAMRRSVSALPYRPLTFIVSQRTASIMNADKIIVLEDGKAVGIGKHDELLATCPVYREIYESQFRKGGER